MLMQRIARVRLNSAAAAIRGLVVSRVAALELAQQLLVQADPVPFRVRAVCPSVCLYVANERVF